MEYNIHIIYTNSYQYNYYLQAVLDTLSLKSKYNNYISVNGSHMRERERERERETETDRQTDRQTDGQRMAERDCERRDLNMPPHFLN